MFDEVSGANVPTRVDEYEMRARNFVQDGSGKFNLLKHIVTKCFLQSKAWFHLRCVLAHLRRRYVGLHSC